MIDLKSGAPRERSVELTAYMPQLDAYAEALGRIFPGVPVPRLAILWTSEGLCRSGRNQTDPITTGPMVMGVLALRPPRTVKSDASRCLACSGGLAVKSNSERWAANQNPKP